MEKLHYRHSVLQYINISKWLGKAADWESFLEYMYIAPQAALSSDNHYLMDTSSMEGQRVINWNHRFQVTNMDNLSLHWIQVLTLFDTDLVYLTMLSKGQTALNDLMIGRTTNYTEGHGHQLTCVTTSALEWRHLGGNLSEQPVFEQIFKQSTNWIISRSTNHLKHNTYWIISRSANHSSMMSSYIMINKKVEMYKHKIQMKSMVLRTKV